MIPRSSFAHIVEYSAFIYADSQTILEPPQAKKI
jgi:hypothetical protein